MIWLRDIDIWFADHVFVHKARHYRYALSLLRQEAEAEDIVQEAYARLFALKDWAAIVDPHAFTIRIIRNLAIERFRAATIVPIDQTALLQTLDPIDDAPTPDVVAADRSELRRVAAALDEMPPRMREAMVLRRIEGLPPAQVAEKMEISVSTVEKHLVRGLRLLVERLSRPGHKTTPERETKWQTKGQAEGS